MHELAVCEAIAETVRDRAKGRVPESVRVRIGYLRQVVPDSLVFSWEMVTAGTDLHSLDAFRNLVLKQSGGAIVRLKDVANLAEDAANKSSKYQRQPRRPARGPQGDRASRHRCRGAAVPSAQR